MSLTEGNNEIVVDLRQLAEDSLKNKLISLPIIPSEADWQKLVLELKVHQIELEMQNDELVKAKEMANAAVKKAEIAIEKYTELYDFAPSGYFTLSKEGIILDINFRAARMLNKKRSLLRNSSFGFFVSNDTKQIYNNFLINTFDSNNTQSCEVTILMDNRVPMYIQLSGIILENKDQCLINVLDITDRKHTEQQLKQIRQNYESFFNSIDELFFVVNTNGNIILANNAVYEHLGYKSKDLAGKTIFTLFSSDLFNDTSQGIVEMLTGIKKQCSLPVVSKQGLLIPVITQVSSGIWDNLPVVFWVSKEITQENG